MQPVTENVPPASSPPAAPPPERCAVCGTAFVKDAAFCTNCGALRPSLVGRPLPYASPRIWVWQQHPPHQAIAWRETGKAVSAILMLSIVAMTFLSLFTLLYGISIVGPAILDGTGHLGSYGLFVVLPFLVTFLTLSGGALFAYYMFIVFAIVTSVAWVYARSVKGFAQEIQGKGNSREHSSLFDTYALLCASLFFTEATVLLLVLLGMDTGASSISTGNLADSLFLLANAAVWEEIAVRVLLIGIPLLVIDLIRRKARDRPYRYVLGGGFRFGAPESALVVISAVVFGIAHWEGHWPLWKIPDAAVAGLAFGYLFLRHGLPSAILFHFVNDYLIMPSEVFSTTTGMLTLVTGLLVLAWSVLGAVFLVYYVTRIAEFATGRNIFERRPVAYGVPGIDPRLYGLYTPPQTYGPPPLAQTARPPEGYGVVPGQAVGHGYTGGYVCPICGNTQARWVDGKFQCLSCGHVS